MKTIIKILCVLTLVFGLSSCGYERIDDRAGLEESYEILKYVVDEIKLNQQGNQ